MLKYNSSTTFGYFWPQNGVLHTRYPRAVIVGHRDLNPGKDCPGFENVAKEYADLQPK